MTGAFVALAIRETTEMVEIVIFVMMMGTAVLHSFGAPAWPYSFALIRLEFDLYLGKAVAPVGLQVKVP